MKIVIAVIFIVMAWISMDAIIAQPILTSHTRIITTTYLRSEEHPQKGGTYYYIYTKNFGCYQIGNQSSRCFNYDTFLKSVKTGDSLTIRIKIGADSEVPISAVELSSNREDYLTLDCINKEINDSKKATPILCFIFFATTLIYFLYRREKYLRK